MKDLHIGSVQLRIMQVLWEKGRATAREITAALNRDSGQEIAHSTVQTLLRQLEDKGAISHKKEDRTFIFSPLIDQKNVTQTEIGKLKNRLFGGSAGNLVTYLLEQEKIPRRELVRIKKMIERKESRQ